MPGIGILGGTFNPPHAGHVELARHARDELGARARLLMPVHTPPHKRRAPTPVPRTGSRCAGLAVAGEPGIGACDVEVRRGGPSYTADTLEQVHASHPEAELTFVVGADTGADAPEWRDPERVLALARLAVAGRQGTDGAAVLDAIGTIAPVALGVQDGDGPQARVVFLEMDPLEGVIHARASAGRRGREHGGTARAGGPGVHRPQRPLRRGRGGGAVSGSEQVLAAAARFAADKKAHDIVSSTCARWSATPITS